MAAAWPLNLGSARDWAFTALPNPHLNGRAIPMSMGKVPGGGSCINVMLWARGHKSDWDSWAAQAGDPAWSHDSVLAIYRGIENWQGAPDPARRGQNGLLCITPPIDPNPIAPAMLDAAAERSIPVYDDVNGSVMEGPGGASYTRWSTTCSHRQSSPKRCVSTKGCGCIALMAGLPIGRPSIRRIGLPPAAYSNESDASASPVGSSWSGLTLRVYARN